MPADLQPDWTLLLPRDVFGEVILVLRGALPPPISDAPGDRGRQERAAMAAVAGLLPINAAEGRLAAQFVVADAQAMDCLLLARERRREPDGYKCRAQAISFMRESKCSLRQLQKLQARREQANDTARDQAAWTEHAATSMMRDAMAPVLAAAAEDVSFHEIESSDAGFETEARLTPELEATIPALANSAGMPVVDPVVAIASAQPAASWPTTQERLLPATPSSENSPAYLLKTRG
jgi:hypothetical protein